jgi:dephospho-CoA kinase
MRLELTVSGCIEDNVCRQVVERHMLQSLPDIFGPERVAAYNDEDTQRIGAEMPENIVKRRQLRELHANLRESLIGLKR